MHLLLPRAQPALERAALRARHDPYGVRSRLVRGARGLAAEPFEVIVAAWVYSPDLAQALVVCHPRFGWLTAGGRLEPDEDPAEGALREAREETGVEIRLAAPDAVCVLGGEDPARVGLAYRCTADPAQPLHPEPGQPARWVPVGEQPPSRYALDDAPRRHPLCESSADVDYGEIQSIAEESE
jgi:8-oxo-dGTP pyrophosphatase MutT (NUDIX family)